MIYKIDSLNYASSGTRRGMVNLDYSSKVDARVFLGTEGNSGISGVCSEGTSPSALMLCCDYFRRNFVDEKEMNRSFAFDLDMGTVSGETNILVDPPSSEGQEIDLQKRISPMYDVMDVMFKSPIDKVNRKNRVLPMTEREMDIYAPVILSSPLGFCNFDDRTIMMTRGQKEGPRYIDTSFRESRNRVTSTLPFYNTQIGEKVRNEYSYPPPGSLSSGTSSYGQYVGSIGGYDKDSFMSAFYEIFRQDANNREILHSNILDVEQSVKTLDFRSGDMWATANPTKSIYDGTYTTEGGDPDLSGTREYKGVIESGNRVYLKYCDDVFFSGGTSSENEHGTKVYRPERNPGPPYGYQKIERYNPTKVSRTARHKSNLFSVRVLNSGLGYDNTEESSMKYRMDIENAVRQIVENITPVNTQLFKVYFEENAT